VSWEREYSNIVSMYSNIMIGQKYKLIIFFVNKKMNSKNYHLILSVHQAKVFYKRKRTGWI